jgi:hypothetical protein
MNKTYRIGAVLLLTMLLLFVTFSLAQFANAAPPAIITPVSVPGDRAGASTAALSTFCNAKSFTADGRCTSVWAAMQYSVVDLQYVIDQGTVNTVTLKLQFSNDGVNWTDGATLVSGNAADANNLAQYAVYGRYVNVYADVANTNPVTITIIGVGK